MKCPFCQWTESKVTDSRNAQDVNAIRRRRECLRCFKRFTTFETVDLVLQVRKRNGTYEDFQQEKLIRGLHNACRYSRISYDGVQKIATNITKKLQEKQIREISAEELGQLCMDYLKNNDVLAYIRFTCVYKRFKDIEELIEVIRVLDTNSK